MVYNSLRLKIVVRIILISLTIFLIIAGYFVMDYVLTPSVLIIVAVIQIMELIYTIEKYFNNYNKLLQSVKYKDFTSSILNTPEDKILKEQKAVITEIIDAFQDVRIEKENHYHYLTTLVEHLETGIISYSKNGAVNLINTAAKNLLGLKHIKNLSSLKNVDIKLYESIIHLKSGEQKTIQTICNKEVCQLLLRSTAFVMQNKSYKLVSFQNIKTELDLKEQESWHKLIRILNHEVMNSLTPVVTLSKELNDTFFDKNGNKIPISNLPDEDFEDIYLSTKTIEKRSRGLLNFIKSYRNFTKLPEPKLQKTLIKELIESTVNLLNSELNKANVQITINRSSKDIFTQIDKELMEQVLINLILNAKEALNDVSNPQIKIEYHTDNQFVNISIHDNGKGISKEHIDKIFVPFFTTKRKGSGIGLSLSKQIVLAHKGKIVLSSALGKGTVVKIKLPVS